MAGHIYDLAAHLLECVALRLGPRSPARACVVPGTEVSFENCCGSDQGGQLTINVISTYPSRIFPDPDRGQPQNCPPPYIVAQYGVTLLRCTPVGSGTKAPTCEQLDANAQLTMRDQEEVQAGVICCLQDEDTITTLIGQQIVWVLNDQATIGPQGGCAGSQQLVLVGFSCRIC